MRERDRGRDMGKDGREEKEGEGMRERGGGALVVFFFRALGGGGGGGDAVMS